MKIFSQDVQNNDNKDIGTTRIVQRDESVEDRKSEAPSLRRWLSSGDEFTGFDSPPGRF
jgi:hypothetical protein